MRENGEKVTGVSSPLNDKHQSPNPSYPWCCNRPQAEMRINSMAPPPTQPPRTKVRGTVGQTCYGGLQAPHHPLSTPESDSVVAMVRDHQTESC